MSTQPTPTAHVRDERELIVSLCCFYPHLSVDTIAIQANVTTFDCVEILEEPESQRRIAQLNNLLAQREHFRAMEARREATATMLDVIRENPTSAQAARFALALYHGSKPSTRRSETNSTRTQSSRQSSRAAHSADATNESDPTTNATIQAARNAINAASAVIEEHAQQPTFNHVAPAASTTSVQSRRPQSTSSLDNSSLYYTPTQAPAHRPGTSPVAQTTHTAAPTPNAAAVAPVQQSTPESTSTAPQAHSPTARAQLAAPDNSDSEADAPPASPSASNTLNAPDTTGPTNSNPQEPPPSRQEIAQAA